MRILSLLSFASLGLLYACSQPSSSKHVQINANTEVKNGNVHIDYTDNGNGDTTLLFVHGWAINKSYFSDQIKHFSPRYRVVAMDMPGFGQSGKNRDKWDTKTYASDVAAVIDQLKLKNVVLIGHSMAGDIVLEAALEHPKDVIGIVGVDNFKGVGWVPSAKDKKDMADAVKQMNTHFVSFATAYFNQQLFSKTTPGSVKKRILNDVAHTDSVIATKAMAEGEYQELPNLKKYGKKLNLINSDYQPTDTSELVKNRLPYKLMNIHGTGHYPMNEAPEEFNRALEAVLKQL